ncbi:MAG: anti-sigma factor family protein [Candidatus Aminicenantales bacterium]
MEHQKMKELISSYYDGELNEDQVKVLKEHLAQCSDCQREFEEMAKFEEVMSNMELKKPASEVWYLYWASIYNRLERRIGWILLSLGAMILAFFGGYKMVENIIKDPSLSVVLKVGILVFLIGIVILLVSVIRERIFIRRRERYKEVEK